MPLHEGMTPLADASTENPYRPAEGGRLKLPKDETGTENPVKSNRFRKAVGYLVDPKTGIRRNVFHSTTTMSLPKALWDCSWLRRERQWAYACIASYQSLPPMPTPVSPSEMAGRWGCSHTWARNLILGSWDWVGVSARHYVHSSWVDEASWVWKACLEAPNTLSCLAAVNRLREYVPAQDENKPAGSKSVGGWLGRSSFTRLRAIGVLHPCRGMRSRQKMYYVPEWDLCAYRRCRGML